jgi:hypothetical protein
VVRDPDERLDPLRLYGGAELRILASREEE